VRPRLTASLAGLLLVAAALAGCSEDNPSGSDDDSGSDAPTAGPTDYLPVPDGVELTAQGSDLALGEPATVAWLPEENVTAVLELTVTAFEQVDIDQLSSWDLDQATRTTTPYFVRATAQNLGDTNLANVAVPLYLADGVDTLIPPSTFEGLFKPCPSRPLPKPFRPDARTALCFVYLLPEGGDFSGARFYPGSGFDPINWTGQASAPKPEQPDKADKSGKADKSDKSDKNGADEKQN
jgi:hypothetical protein